jgi:hypothetical protein
VIGRLEAMLLKRLYNFQFEIPEQGDRALRLSSGRTPARTTQALRYCRLPPCSAEQPGVRAVAEKLLVHGEEYLAVLEYLAPFAAEQLHSLTTSISRAGVPATLYEGIKYTSGALD